MSDPSSSMRMHFAGAQNAFFAVGFGLLGLIVGWACGTLLPHRAARANTEAQLCVAGPWGHVRYVDTLIEAPESAIRVAAMPTNTTTWFLDVLSPLALKQKLRTCSLNAEQIEELLKYATPATNGTGYVLQPSDAFVIGLTPPDRANLYALLTGYTQNVAQVAPFRFDLETKKDWFESAHLGAPVETLVRQLVYSQNNLRLFSDLPLVLRRHPDPAVYAALFRALSREATVLASLRISPDDHLKDLAYYWGWPDREESVLTLLQTAQFAGPNTDVPLALLLPPFARDRLDQYPNGTDPEFSSSYYTCMNFFSTHPDPRYAQPAEVERALREDYLEVPDPEYQLGDVILFERKGEGVVHACNYVADHLVFTKNGGALVRPWLLVRLNDLVSFYSYPKPVTVKVLRRRDLIKHTRAAS